MSWTRARGDDGNPGSLAQACARRTGPRSARETVDHLLQAGRRTNPECCTRSEVVAVVVRGSPGPQERGGRGRGAVPPGPGRCSRRLGGGTSQGGQHRRPPDDERRQPGSGTSATLSFPAQHGDLPTVPVHGQLNAEHRADAGHLRGQLRRRFRAPRAAAPSKSTISNPRPWAEEQVRGAPVPRSISHCSTACSTR